MKYLDERIVASLTGVNKTGLIQYRVYRLRHGYAGIDLDNPNTYDIIFVGNCYKQSSATAFTVDITDIVRNDAWVPKEDELYGATSSEALDNKLVSAYYVHVPSTNSLSSKIQVAKVYPYPHHISTMQDNVFFDWIKSVNSASFPLQGRYSDGGKGKYHLTPRYPYISTDNYRMILASEVGLNITTSVLEFSGKLIGRNSVTFTPPSSVVSYKLSSLYNNTYYDVIYGALGAYHQGQQQYFTANVNSSGAIITSVNQNDLYVKLVQIDDNRNVVREFTNWVETDYQEEAQLTLDSSFFDANNNNAIRVLLSNDNTVTPTSSDNYDSIEYKFDITSDSEAALIGKTFDFTLGFFEVSWMYQWRLPNFNLTYTPTTNKTLVEVAGDYVAEIDTNCISRYYLQWQDRMGGFQSQPFNDKYTYSESFETETLTDYQGRKRTTNVGVTSKFKINTDWLPEDLYPYYESIFTSPLLFLYDTKEDKRYAVIVTDSEYTEKTFNNQKRLFNITLNLELNNKQNIVY